MKNITNLKNLKEKAIEKSKKINQNVRVILLFDNEYYFNMLNNMIIQEYDNIKIINNHYDKNEKYNNLVLLFNYKYNFIYLNTLYDIIINSDYYYVFDYKNFLEFFKFTNVLDQIDNII